MGDTHMNGPDKIRRHRRRRFTGLVLAAVAALAAALTVSSVSLAGSGPAVHSDALGVPVPATVSPSLYLTPKTATPIQHLVVIFDENESFDHYFGTYPDAANTTGSSFHAKKGTPHPVNLLSQVPGAASGKNYLNDNPNEFPPSRLTPSEALTCDQNHDYVPEQDAVNDGAMNMFVQDTESSDDCNVNAPAEFFEPGLVMDYYDGNTVTALWNYAQYYAMSDNNYDTAFGPSTPGALNVTSGVTAGAEAFNPTWDPTDPSENVTTSDSDIKDVNSSTGLGVLYTDSDPYYDDCADSNHTTDGPLAALTGENIGDLLNAAHVSWGWFQGGFAPTSTNSGGAVCGSEHENIGGVEVADYVPHHNPFQYNATTANPAHLPPSSLAAIGHTDQANHNYDISYFFDALDGTGGARLPAVSYLKPPAYENAHPGYSDPLDEQTFIVNTINQIEESKYWSSTAIIITYDDSDGWYDHVAPTITEGSNDPSTDTAMCTAVAVTIGTYNDRCGPSQRLPMIVISPWTRENYVSNNLTDTSSVVKFIEDNWLHGERIPGSFDATAGSLDAPGGLLDFQVFPHLTPLILSPTTGAVVSGGVWWGNEGRTSAKEN